VTHGDHHNLPCPHCTITHDPCPDGREPEVGKVLMFPFECYNCKHKFYVTVAWEIVTRGECIPETGS
jgi:hypothetical protein